MDMNGISGYLGYSRYFDLQAPTAAQLAAAAQTTLYLSTRGSDNAAGTSPGAAWKTGVKLAQAIGDAQVNVPMTITLLDDMAQGDRFITPSIGESGFVVVQGTPKELATGTFTAGTAGATSSTHTPVKVVDSGLSGNWNVSGPGGSSLIGKRIRIMSGARAGAMAWVIKELGSKQARCTQFIVPSLVDPIPASFSSVSPASTDPYAVEELTVIPEIVFRGKMSTNLARIFKCAFAGVRFPLGTATPIVPIEDANPTVAFIGCDLGIIGGGFFAHACAHSNAFAIAGTYALLNACWIDTYFFVQHGADVSILQGSIGQGCKIVADGGYVRLEDVGIFDVVGDALETRVGSHVKATGLIWGNGNSGRGIRAAGLGGVRYEGSKPIVTGTTGDTIIGGTATAYAAVPSFNTSNGAGIVNA